MTGAGLGVRRRHGPRRIFWQASAGAAAELASRPVTRRLNKRARADYDPSGRSISCLPTRRYERSASAADPCSFTPRSAEAEVGWDVITGHEDRLGDADSTVGRGRLLMSVQLARSKRKSRWRDEASGSSSCAGSVTTGLAARRLVSKRRWSSQARRSGARVASPPARSEHGPSPSFLTSPAPPASCRAGDGDRRRRLEAITEVLLLDGTCSAPAASRASGRLVYETVREPRPPPRRPSARGPKWSTPPPAA